MIAFASILALAGALTGLRGAAPAMGFASQQETPTAGEPQEFVVEGADGERLLVLPRDEEIVYRVHVGVAFLRAAVGKVTQTSLVEPYRRSIFMGAESEADGADAAPLESATLTMHATGDYSIYTLDSTIESRHLPQDWPRIIYRLTQAGSSKRRQENLIGTRDGVPTSSYRRDSSRGAPPGARIWKDAVSRTVKGRPLDLLSAVFACRTLITSGRSEMSVPLLEKDRLWELTLRRGRSELVETGAGEFDAVEVLLEPAPWPDEEIQEEDIERFEGLFGLHGTISIWCEARTGIPLRIQGDLPVGPINIRIDVVIDGYRGTTPEFRPAGEALKESSSGTPSDRAAGTETERR